MEELNLIDIYRQINHTKKYFTYESKPLNLKSRIKVFLISRPLSCCIKNTEIRTSIAPDHKSIFLNIEIKNEFARGPGLWKFNNTLLEDENYKELIEFFYPQILVKYREIIDKKIEFGKSALTCTPFSKTKVGLKKFGGLWAFGKSIFETRITKLPITIKKGFLLRKYPFCLLFERKLGKLNTGFCSNFSIAKRNRSLNQRFLGCSMCQPITKQTSAKNVRFFDLPLSTNVDK